MESKKRGLWERVHLVSQQNKEPCRYVGPGTIETIHRDEGDVKYDVQLEDGSGEEEKVPKEDMFDDADQAREACRKRNKEF